MFTRFCDDKLNFVLTKLYYYHYHPLSSYSLLLWFDVIICPHGLHIISALFVFNRMTPRSVAFCLLCASSTLYLIKQRLSNRSVYNHNVCVSHRVVCVRVFCALSFILFLYLYLYIHIFVTHCECPTPSVKNILNFQDFIRCTRIGAASK